MSYRPIQRESLDCAECGDRCWFDQKAYIWRCYQCGWNSPA